MKRLKEAWGDYNTMHEIKIAVTEIADELKLETNSKIIDLDAAIDTVTNLVSEKYEDFGSTLSDDEAADIGYDTLLRLAKETWAEYLDTVNNETDQFEYFEDKILAFLAYELGVEVNDLADDLDAWQVLVDEPASLLAEKFGHLAKFH